MTRTQAIANLKSKIDATRSLEVVTAPKLQPRELFLQIGRKRYQVASVRAAIEMYSVARDNAEHGASGMPSITIVSNTGLHLYRVSYNGRVWDGDRELTGF